MLTEEQIQKRKTGIGGSDAAAVCGISPYKSAYQVYLDKLGLNEQEESKDYFYFGNLLEPVVADEYAKRTRKSLSILDKTIIHNKYPWMIANIDRLIDGENKILECKVAMYSNKEFGEEGSDEMPTQYLMQCAHYAAVLNIDSVDLAVLAPFSKNMFRIYTYIRNENLEKKLIEIEHDFWHEHVLKEIPPLPVSSQEANLIWKENNQEMVLADLNDSQALMALITIKNKIKEFEQQKDQYELQIKKKLQNASSLNNEYGKVLATWNIQSVNRVDIGLLKKNYPDIYQSVLKQSTTRVLRIKEAI